MKNNVEVTLYKYKSGISLVILVVTIVVALILIGVLTASTGNAIADANLTTFTSDLVNVQDSAEAYYVLNGVLPTLDGSDVMDVGQLLSISNDSNIMTDEIVENRDEDSDFYIIDLAKINVKRAAYGNGELGLNDYFVVALPTMNVYYPYGLYVNGAMYFSLTSKISNITNINPTETGIGSTNVISSGSIRVTQNTGWANKMGVNIEVDMENGETLFMSVSNGPNRQIATTIGKNIFSFDLLSAIVAGTESIKIPTLTVQEANNIEQGILSVADRYVDILKYRGVDLLGRVRINLSNFSTTLPTIADAQIATYESINTVKLQLASSESGIEKVRYEYLTKYTDNATIENYYENVSDFDETYMTTNAKVATVTPKLTTTIAAPKNVQSLKVAVIDKANNVNLYNQEIAPRLYIGYTIDSDTLPNIQVTSNIYSSIGVKSVSFSVSTDNINFTDEQTYTINTTTNGITTMQSVPFTNLEPGTAYLKIVATNYDSTLTETRIIELKVKEELFYGGNRPILAPGMFAQKWNKTMNSWETVENPNSDTSWYDYKNGIWANAQTLDGSMWVWIPRYIYNISNLWHFSSNIGGIINVRFTKGTDDNWDYTKIGYIDSGTSSNSSNKKWTNHPAFKFGNTELTGIWIAKFEASGNINSINIKPGASSLRSLTIDEAFIACRNMKTNNKYGWGTTGSGIDTHLIKNTEWGAAVYLGQSIYNNTMAVNDNNSYYTGGGIGLSYINNASQSNTGNIYGIYDMSGGAIEYTSAYINNGNKTLSQRGYTLINSDSKYRDVYTVTSDTKAINFSNAINLKGDAIYETSNNLSAWYKDSLDMPYSGNPFFTRGGHYNEGDSAGMFGFSSTDGKKNKQIGFRPVLIVGSGL